MAEFCFLVVCLLINAASELEQCTHLISDYILSLLFAILGQAHSHVYTAVNANRERKNQFGPFSVTNQDQCELACNCARGDASEIECSQLPKAIPSMDCRIYYYTASWCSFLGDFTMNTCILPIVEHQLVQAVTTTTPSTVMPTTTGCPPGGVWSEWTTEPCPTTCGSCTNITRTRTCTTRCGNCTCEGPDTDIGPCGISLCPFPSNTCCGNYVRFLNYDANWFFCGTENIPLVVCPGEGSTTLSP